MKWLLALSLLLVSMAAQAASPEESYLAARDTAIAKFSSPDAPDLEQHEAALAELAGMLRPFVGPVSIKGLPADEPLPIVGPCRWAFSSAFRSGRAECR